MRDIRYVYMFYGYITTLMLEVIKWGYINNIQANTMRIIFTKYLVPYDASKILIVLDFLPNKKFYTAWVPVYSNVKPPSS